MNGTTATGPAAAMLSVVEAARRLGVSRQTVYDHIKRGALQAYRRPLGRGMFVREADVERLTAFEPVRQS